MFIWSFRMSKRELIIIGAGLVVFITVLTVLLCSAGTQSTAAPFGENYTVAAADETQRRAFLEQFGWQTDPDPLSVREVTLPAQMDERLSEYNTIQHLQGFDLAELCGQRIKLWTYNVTNHPAGGKVVANLMIRNGIVVGGDISSLRTGGFSHGFDPDVSARSAAAAQAQTTAVDRSVPDRIPADENVPPEPDGDEE